MRENLRGWIKNIVDIAVIVLIVLAAKTAIAEPFYVPSGSMEPTLLIGDELLATKFPYGYSGASLPSFLIPLQTPRVLSALPKRGDVVVFRWPGDRSQVWVKRVIGLPGDRIGLRNGRVSINGTPVGIRPAGVGESEVEDGSVVAAARFIETLPGGREHSIFKLVDAANSTTRLTSSCRRTICSLWATIATIQPTAACRCARAASACCRSRILWAASMPLSVRGISPSNASRSQEWPSGLRLSRFFTGVH